MANLLGYISDLKFLGRKSNPYVCSAYDSAMASCCGREGS